VHDGIHLEKAGIPAATICTEPFQRTAKAMASMWGAADYPVIYAPHPVGGLSMEAIRSRAEELLDQVVAVITGVESPNLAARH
jgi:hypothetical protein